MKKGIGLLFATVLAAGAIGLTACGGDDSKQYAATVDFSGGNEYITCYDTNTIINSGSEYILNVGFTGGYLPEGIIATVNGKSVEGKVRYNDGGSLTGEIDYSKTIYWSYEVKKVNSDLDIHINVANCKKGKVKLNVSSDVAADAQYALVKDGVKYVTALNASTLQSNFAAISDNKIDVDYNGVALLALPKSYYALKITYADGQTQENVISPVKYMNKTFEFNGKNVFAVKNVTSVRSVSNYASEEYYDDIFNTQYPELLTCVTFDSSDSKGISLSWITPKDVGGSNVTTVDGVDLYNISQYNGSGDLFYSYMYIGSAGSPAEDTANSGSYQSIYQLEEIDKDALYLLVNYTTSIPLNKIKFYAAANTNLANPIDITSSLVQGDNGKYVLKITKQQVQLLITEETVNNMTVNTGHFVVYWRAEQSVLNENFVRINVNLNDEELNKFHNAVEIVRRVALDSEYQQTFGYAADYTELNDNRDMTLYFDKEKLFPDSGGSVLVLYDPMFAYTAGNTDLMPTSPRFDEFVVKVSGDNDPRRLSMDEYVTLPLIKDRNVTSNTITLDISYHTVAPDASEHKLSFSSDYRGNIFFSDDPFKPLDDWTQSMPSAEIKLKHGTPLYYYMYSGSASSLGVYVTEECEDTSEFSLVNYYMWEDILGNYIYETTESGTIIVYVMELSDVYLEEGCTLYVR